jgi:hypothetical protein
VQLNYKARHEYTEVTPDHLDSLQAKFYHRYTTRFLKLGFGYICDLRDRTQKNPNAGAVFRVMASTDDGVVVSFYPIKPPLAAKLIRWSNGEIRRALRFETEFSDGHIIISCSTTDKNAQSLPETITLYLHPADISVEGLLHKHRVKIKRYQTQHPGVNIMKVDKTDEFFALRDRQYRLIYDHIRSIGWVTKEYLSTQIKNQKVATQVYDKIQRNARS